MWLAGPEDRDVLMARGKQYRDRIIIHLTQYLRDEAVYVSVSAGGFQ